MRWVLVAAIVIFLLPFSFGKEIHDDTLDHIQKNISLLQSKERTAQENIALAQLYFAYDTHLAEINGVRPNNEPLFLLGNSSTGLVLIHGFSASPHEVYSFAKFLNYEEGITVYAPRLAGHGTDYTEFGNYEWVEWVNSTEHAIAAVSAVSEDVFIGGISMGGNIALEQAKKKEFKGVFSISAPIHFYDKRIMFAGIARWFVDFMPNSKLSESDKRYYYYNRSVHAVYELTQFVNYNKLNLNDVEEPILILQSSRDTTIDPVSADYIYDHVGSSDKSVIPYESNSHILVDDYERDIVFNDVLWFIRNNK